ncbi:MAG TPA: hypothetical protein VFI90_15015 [Rubrobacter sp.]|nr:hypothetical protein [Rubrobacter sp.]
MASTGFSDASTGSELKVKPGMGEGYDWVECAAGWQVPHYAESVG